MHVPYAFFFIDLCPIICCIYVVACAGEICLSCIPKIGERDSDHPRKGSDLGADAIVCNQCECMLKIYFKLHNWLKLE